MIRVTPNTNVKSFRHSMMTLLATLALFSSLAFASEGGSDSDRLIRTLDLNADQKAKFSQIMDQQQKKHHAIKEQLKHVHKETVNALSGILTVDQLEKFERMTEKRKEKCKSGSYKKEIN